MHHHYNCYITPTWAFFSLRSTLCQYSITLLLLLDSHRNFSGYLLFCLGQHHHHHHHGGASYTSVVRRNKRTESNSTLFIHSLRIVYVWMDESEPEMIVQWLYTSNKWRLVPYNLTSCPNDHYHQPASVVHFWQWYRIAVRYPGDIKSSLNLYT